MRVHKHVIVIRVIPLPGTKQFHVSLLASPALSSISHVAGPMGVLPGAPKSASPWPRHSFYT